MAQYYVYIMTNYRGTLYTGVTSDLTRRVYEHRHALVDGFTKKYNISKLVYFEATNSVESAIAREKQFKNWRRIKKTELVEAVIHNGETSPRNGTITLPPRQTPRSTRGDSGLAGGFPANRVGSPCRGGEFRFPRGVGGGSGRDPSCGWGT